ncbi:hypothetical protein D9M68_788110 [compost metagenome]
MFICFCHFNGTQHFEQTYFCGRCTTGNRRQDISLRNLADGFGQVYLQDTVGLDHGYLAARHRTCQCSHKSKENKHEQYTRYYYGQQ